MTRLRLDNWCVLPTPMGEFRMYDTGDEDMRLVCVGDPRDQGDRPLLRVHSSCLASELFGATDCDCADQLRTSMRMIADERRGLVVHLHQEGRGQGLSKKISAVHAMQQGGLDTVEAFEALGLEQDTRDYRKAVALLRELSIDTVRLISNNPTKVSHLTQMGLGVEMVTTQPTVRPENADYLKSKQAKLGHRLALNSAEAADGDVLFYHSDEPWGEFSNFSRHAVFVRGRIWPTVEHFYQAQKFAGTPHEESIRRSPTPTVAKQRATVLSEPHPGADWEAQKEELMLEALRAKFAQHPDLRERLLATGHRKLAEHTRHDAYWGDSGDGTGHNRLGHLLMQVRNELHEVARSSAGAN